MPCPDQHWKVGVRVPLWNIIHISSFYLHTKYSGIFLREDKKFFHLLTIKLPGRVTVTDDSYFPENDRKPPSPSGPPQKPARSR